MRPRTWLLLLALGVALLSALAPVSSAPSPVAGAQTRPKIPPPDFQREWELDAEGLRQWKPFDVDCTHCKGAKSMVCEHCKDSELAVCLECNLTKRATCRTCGGTGKMPDPLVEQACPFCWGSSWYPCGLCNSFGFMRIENKETKCGACKQKGLLSCVACAGKRRVDTIKLGRKGVGEAGAKELREHLDDLRACIAALEEFEPDANPSRSFKAFAKTLAPIERDLKAVKDMEKMLDEVLKGVKSYGAGYSGYEDRLMQQFFVFKDRTVFLLQHQVRAAEQSLERAEFNESK